MRREVYGFFNRDREYDWRVFNINTVHTVSVWYYNTHPFVIPSGPDPFEPTDVNTEFYNWTDRQNRVLKGLGRKRVTIGFNRFIPKPWGNSSLVFMGV